MPRKGQSLSEEQKKKMAEGKAKAKAAKQAGRLERPHVGASPAERSKRPERVPLGVPRSKLTVRHTIPGHRLRWINDIGNRINDALYGDYLFVTQDEVGTIGDPNVTPGNQDLGNCVSKTVGTQENGIPLVAYLMKIPREIYEQDQKDKQTDIDLSEQAMLRGEHADDGEVEQKYIPSEGIHINHPK